MVAKKWYYLTGKTVFKSDTDGQKCNTSEMYLGFTQF